MSFQRLYNLFRPQNYNLRIGINRQKRTFSGQVTITGQTPKIGSQITLHACQLDVTSASIDGKPVKIELGKDTVSLHERNIPSGKHVLKLSFSGKISDPMHGMYPCYFKLGSNDEELLATQFESHHAREVFPCVDEPEAKATFDLTIVSEADVRVISNTPIKKQATTGHRMTTAFETTPVMSAYLLAWVIGKLDYQEATTASSVTVRAYATPDKKSQLAYALSEAVKLLEFFDDYFGISYPLPKCDLVALPDFSSGAMENWGCITFRETALLADDGSSAATKQYITSVIAHELAHQWFGNLVTMQWWDDLWLNESFANLMETLATDHLHPEWGMWTQYFDQQTRRAFQRDSLANVQKIQQEVNLPEEIGALFDPAIVYAKGGSLLNMLHAHIGAKAFQSGLHSYLSKHQYSNTTASDLWQALGEASGQDIVSFMQPWISQSGLPVVSIAPRSDGAVSISQKRFYSNKRQTDAPTNTVWPIPLMSDHLDTPIFGQTAASMQHTSAQPLLLNRGRKGYYVSLYFPDHLQQLAAQMSEGNIDAVDRLGLLGDSLQLSQAGLLPYVSALGLLEACTQESSYPVWGAINSHIHALKMFADDDSQQLAGLRTMVGKLASTQHARLGLLPTEGEPHYDSLLRPAIIAHMAYAGDAATISSLFQMLAQATKPSDINENIRVNTLKAAARHDSKATFDQLALWYRTTTSAEERKQIIQGFASLSDQRTVQLALNMLSSGEVRSQDVFYWIAFLAQGQHTRDPLWQWVQANWQWCLDKFAGDMHLADFPKHIASSFSTPQQLQEYKQFFEPKLSQPGLTRTITQGIEDIESRVLWRERDQESVARYLRTSR